MRIEVFKNYRDDFPEDHVICLCDYSTSDLELFTDFIVNINATQFMDLSKQFFIDSSSCSLIFIIDTNGNGIVEKGNNEYECRLSFHNYVEMGGILKEALKRGESDSPSNYYWLYDKNTPSSYCFPATENGNFRSFETLTTPPVVAAADCCTACGTKSLFEFISSGGENKKTYYRRD